MLCISTLKCCKQRLDSRDLEHALLYFSLQGGKKRWLFTRKEHKLTFFLPLFSWNWKNPHILSHHMPNSICFLTPLVQLPYDKSSDFEGNFFLKLPYLVNWFQWVAKILAGFLEFPTFISGLQPDLAKILLWMINQCYFDFSLLQNFNSLVWWLKGWVIYSERDNSKKESLLKTKDNFFLFFISWFSHLKTDRKQLNPKRNNRKLESK